MIATSMVLVGMPACLLVLLRWLQRVPHWGGLEMQRKIVHITMGLASLPLPWLPLGPLVVPLTATIMLLLLLLLRWLPALRATLGSALHGIGRPSLGELCFPLAVALVYVLARNEPHFYAISLLVLALADPAAACVGTSLGHSAKPGGKTLAGSLAFFGVALCCSVGGLLLTGLDLNTVLTVGVLLAGLTTEIERRSRFGLDNLFVPLGSCGFLLAVL